MVDEAFRYEQLDLTKQQIRLVTVKPKSPEREDVECDIHVFDVDTAPPYGTLSYTWGWDTPRPILLNGKRFVVRQNLYHFLRSYRDDPSNVHFIWIDQICISQAHTGERNHQVCLMSQIYSKCIYVVIWLGVQDRGEAKRFVTLPVPGTTRISDCPYFQRLWVVQEILLSREVRVLYGSVWMSWDEIKASHARDTGRHSRTDTLPFVLGMSILEIAIRQDRNAGELTLYECLHYFSIQECHDSRDKVYGLLGLVKEGQRPDVAYKKSVEQVFLGALRAIPLADWLTTTGSFVYNLYRISHYMGLEKHSEGITSLLWSLKHFYASLLSDKEYGSKDHNPLTAMGYEDVGPAGEINHWWYEHDGKRFSSPFSFASGDVLLNT
ncbi:hypothetical protein HBH53_240810 [Parastagonospora nodorum]|nr:hypothetical protein HBH53_240810 [Parastagonospora nodorum]KAH3957051.1 hypothetical protein HBH51_230310 [Parastagonospora nodorum]KAH4118086.1 hypothetical protein HBH47_146800 [Parastagonospora nodorum]KAH4185801.1 hypothetical protein HBH42_176890 [Parastagonospora nodorum]KAH5023782.1 hypothetical protein HBI75_154950 [Parastagonospora nodorum]